MAACLEICLEHTHKSPNWVLAIGAMPRWQPRPAMALAVPIGRIVSIDSIPRTHCCGRRDGSSTCIPNSGEKSKGQSGDHSLQLHRPGDRQG